MATAAVSELDFRVVHRKGSSHGDADALSRYPHVLGPSGEVTYKCVCVPVHPGEAGQRAAVPARGTEGSTASGRSAAEVTADPENSNDECCCALGVRAMGDAQQPERMICTVPNMTEADISREQDRDGGLRELKVWKASKTRPLAKNLKTDGARRLLRDWGSLVIRDAVLHKRIQPRRAAPICLQIVLPQHLRKEVMDALHAGFGGGHQGVARLESMVKERFHWPGL